jgi:hypothetical protein
VSQEDRMTSIERKATLDEAAVAAAKIIPAKFESGGYGLDYWRAVAEAVLASDIHRGAETDLVAAVRLLNDARTTIIDTDLRREWEAERARLRAAVEGSNP